VRVQGPSAAAAVLPPIPAETGQRYSKHSPLSVLFRQQVQFIREARWRLFSARGLAPQRGYDEPAILSYAISSFCPTSADGLQLAADLRIAEMMDLGWRFLVAALANCAGAVIEDVPSQVEVPTSGDGTTITGHVVVFLFSAGRTARQNQRTSHDGSYVILRIDCHRSRRDNRQKSSARTPAIVGPIVGPSLVDRRRSAVTH